MRELGLGMKGTEEAQQRLGQHGSSDNLFLNSSGFRRP
jgi:hypothetical protein